jgi:hypothetical protein
LLQPPPTNEKEHAAQLFTPPTIDAKHPSAQFKVPLRAELQRQLAQLDSPHLTVEPVAVSVTITALPAAKHWKQAYFTEPVVLSLNNTWSVLIGTIAVGVSSMFRLFTKVVQLAFAQIFDPAIKTSEKRQVQFLHPPKILTRLASTTLFCPFKMEENSPHALLRLPPPINEPLH